MNISWTKEQTEYVSKNYLTQSNAEMATSLGKSTSSVMNKLASLKLVRGLQYNGNLADEKWRKWGDLYLISNLGRIYSVLYEKLVKTEFNNKGYVCFNDYSSGKVRKSFVHVLVGKLYVKKPKSDEELELNHIDGNKENCRFDNLEWITHKKNMEHAVRTGLHSNFKHGETSHLNVYSDETVHEVCKQIASGKDVTTIACGLGLKRDYVYRISIKKRSRKISDLYF